jgi:hypothetical protein
MPPEEDPMNTTTRRTRVAAVSALGVSAVVALTGFTPTGANALDVSLRTASHTAVPWSYQSPAGAVRYTLEESVDQAKRFDLIVANKSVYGDNVPAMKAANPNLDLVAYVNGAYAQKSEGTAFPDAWYLRDATGAKVRSNGYGNFLMDVSNPGWIKSVFNRCNAIIVNQGYEGCFLDMMGAASVSAGYGTGIPVDPATGLEYTKAQWLAMTTALSKQVHQMVGAEKPFYVNGIGNGQNYFNAAAPSSQLLDGIDGSLAEFWLRGAEEPLTKYPAEAGWKQNVDMIADATADGKKTLITVKTWGEGTPEQAEAWHEYSLASYLLAADGTGQYQFMATEEADVMTANDTLLDGLRIGAPSAPYAKVGGVYQRTYSNGRVLVNPTKVAVTVSLGGTFTTTTGKTVTSLTLLPNEAEILTRA